MACGPISGTQVTALAAPYRYDSFTVPRAARRFALSSLLS
jgi:hypothetical protein